MMIYDICVYVCKVKIMIYDIYVYVCKHVLAKIHSDEARKHLEAIDEKKVCLYSYVCLLICINHDS